MSIEQHKQWLTARECARLLKVTERMIGHYAQQGKLRTRREGRRVWYFSEDVQRLAETLQADLRPTPYTKEDANRALAEYVQERRQVDKHLLDQTQQLADRQEQLVRGQADLQRQLAEVQKQVAGKQGPSWQLVATLAIVLAILAIALVIVWRLVGSLSEVLPPTFLGSSEVIRGTIELF